MNHNEISNKVRKVIVEQLNEKGYATSEDTLVKMGWLTSKDLYAWQNGKIPYLEKVCNTNLSKLTLMLKEYHKYALENHLRISETFYKRQGSKQKLIFSKSKDAKIEKRYASRILSSNKIDS